MFRLLLLSRSVVSDSLWLHGLQQARLPCPSPSPRACSNSCPLSWWCHQTISSSVVPFSCCLQSFPESGSFPMSWFFASGGQSTGASASASILPMNSQDWFPLGLTGLISLKSKGLSRMFSSTIVWKHQFFAAQPSLWSSCHIHTWLLEKPLSADLCYYRLWWAKWCLCFLIRYLGSSSEKTMGCFSGCLMSSAGIQKLFCGIYSAFKCSFDEFMGEKVVPSPIPLPS